jgi:hypothetical protein
MTTCPWCGEPELLEIGEIWGTISRSIPAVDRDTEAIERALLRKLLTKYEADAPPLRPAAPLPSVADWASDQPSLL